jgi:hypothetical protein
MSDFPNRPDHPDFWLMAECVQDVDAAADDGIALERIIGKVDMESLAYVASLRALRMKFRPGDPRAGTTAAIGAVWIDGFIAGVNFQKRRSLQNPE